MTRVLVISDTRVEPGGHRHLPASVFEHLVDVDLILPAGDVVTGDLLDELRSFAPVAFGSHDARFRA